jgi:hypothetical protein
MGQPFACVLVHFYQEMYVLRYHQANLSDPEIRHSSGRSLGQLLLGLISTVVPDLWQRAAYDHPFISDNSSLTVRLLLLEPKMDENGIVTCF